MPEGGDIEKHINSMVDIVDKLLAIGKQLDEDIFIAAIFNSLPESYATLVTTMESRPEDLNITFVKGKLLEEYRKRKLREAENSSREAAMNVSFNINKGSKNIQCFFCKKSGHLKKNCINYKKWLEKREKSDKGIKSGNSASISFLAKSGGGRSDSWFIDSGASSHMTHNRAFFSKFTSGNMTVQVAKKDIVMNVLGTGSGIIKGFDGKGTQVNIELKNVLYIPSLEQNLNSVSKITDSGLKIKFSETECEVQHKLKTLLVGPRYGDLYKLKKEETANLTVGTEYKHKENCQHVWHRIFGHRDPQAITGLENKLLATGIKLEDCGIKQPCECCIKGKMTRKPFPKESKSSINSIFDLIHTDVCGPIETLTPSNNRYILTLIDDYSPFQPFV